MIDIGAGIRAGYAATTTRPEPRTPPGTRRRGQPRDHPVRHPYPGWESNPQNPEGQRILSPLTLPVCLPGRARGIVFGAQGDPGGRGELRAGTAVAAGAGGGVAGGWWPRPTSPRPSTIARRVQTAVVVSYSSTPSVLLVGGIGAGLAG